MTGTGTDRAAGWRRSTHSGATNCLEVRALRDAIEIRDSKHPAVELQVTRAGWVRLLEGMRGRR